MAALVMRQTRTSMLQVLSEDYVRTARAKGASEGAVLLRHALRNALIPVVTIIGLQTGALVGGAVVTETVFAIPGLGRMIVDGIFERDFPAVQGGILVVVALVLVVNLLTDIAYARVDRRIKL
jgi:peptide/nickel transport system permease protein